MGDGGQIERNGDGLGCVNVTTKGRRGWMFIRSNLSCPASVTVQYAL